MRLSSDLISLAPADRHAVVALGNFDGVHKGHAGLLAAGRALANERNAILGVLTFEPHPRQIFRPEDPPFRLTSAARRAELLEQAGVDIVYQVDFDRDFAVLDAAAFERTFLRDCLGATGIVTGGNFRYGAGRGGNFATLAAFGATHGIPVVSAPTMRDERGEPYSSTRVRQALLDARPDHAAALLGRNWDIDFTVEHGDKRGRQIGFPTANGRFGDLLAPAYGIYAVRTWIESEAEPVDGVASIGIRPMWQTPLPTIEVHLFDFDRDIYDAALRVELVAYLRPEAKFDGIETLVAQIGRDCAGARRALKSTGMETARDSV